MTAVAMRAPRAQVSVQRELTPATQNWVNKTKNCERWYKAKVVGAVALAVLVAAPCLAGAAFGIYFAARVREPGLNTVAMGIGLALKGAILGATFIFLSAMTYMSGRDENYSRPEIANPILTNLRTASLENAFVKMSPTECVKYGFLPEAAAEPLEALLRMYKAKETERKAAAPLGTFYPEQKAIADRAQEELTNIQAQWVRYRQEELISKNLLPEPNSIIRA